MNEISNLSDEIIKKIKESAQLYAIDTLNNPSAGAITFIETAMLLGASIVVKKEMEHNFP